MTLELPENAAEKQRIAWVDARRISPGCGDA
jgi:hypothetical protein